MSFWNKSQLHSLQVQPWAPRLALILMMPSILISHGCQITKKWWLSRTEMYLEVQNQGNLFWRFFACELLVWMAVKYHPCYLGFKSTQTNNINSIPKKLKLQLLFKWKARKKKNPTMYLWDNCLLELCGVVYLFSFFQRSAHILHEG